MDLRRIVVDNPLVAKTWSVRENFAFTKRLQFTMNKKGVKTSLERLEKCTSRIDTWIGRAEKETDETVTRRAKLRFIGSLDAIQSNASKIYATLLQSWCKKEPEHPTFLLMEQRLKRPRNRPKRYAHRASIFDLASEPTCFKVSIGGGCCPQTQHFHTELRVTKDLISR